MSRIYLDTSAYLCVLLGERGGAELERTLAGAVVLSSTLLILETERNLIHYTRQGALDAERLLQCRDRLSEDLRRLVLRQLTLDLCRAPRMPVVSTPRSLDLVHLVTACWFHSQQPIDRFLTLDEAQAIAARELGLPV